MSSNKYSLTTPQKNIYMFEKINKNTSTNNIVGLFKIHNFFDFEKCNISLNKVIKNNDALRLNIFEDNGNVYQNFREYEYEEFECLDFSSNYNEISKYLDDFSLIPFDIYNSKLYDFKIVRVNEKSGFCIVKLHHLISDAYTFMQFENQLVSIYEFLINKNDSVDLKSFSYLDFINSEKEYFRSDKYLVKDKLFFYDYLKDYNNDFVLKDKLSYSLKAGRYSYILDNSDDILRYCKDNKLSPFALIMAVFSIYIYRTLNLNDIVIGSPILNRSNFKEKNTMGMFVSTVPIRIKLNENTKIIDLIRDIGGNTRNVFRHQKYPLNDIISNLNRKNKLFNHMISYQNARADILDNYSSEWVFSKYIQNEFEIHILDMDNTGKLTINYDYLVDKFDLNEVKFINRRFISIINQLINNLDITIDDVNIIDNDERELILNNVNPFKIDFDSNNIVKLFERNVLKNSDRVAYIFENNKLTYGDLNKKANCLARYLKIKYFIRSNDFVPVLSNRGFDMIISILGVLKAGGAYVPIDPSFPIDRINFMINDSNSKIVINNTDIRLNVLNINVNNIPLNMFIDDNLNNKINDNDLAYMIYTSGTTGKPKGCMIEHKNLYNLVNSVYNYQKLSDLKRFVSLSTYSFDIFVLENFIPLSFCKTVILSNEEEQRMPNKMINLIKENNVEVISSTPTRIKLLIDYSNSEILNSVKRIMLGGEVFPKGFFKLLKKIMPNAIIYDGYGPTEITVWSSAKEINNELNINIGKSLPNYTAYVLDNKNRILPLGVKGELCIGGKGVARGYNNRDELNKEKFIKFNNDRIYKTGDLVYIDFNYDLNYVSRMDKQVKLHGLRIELSEIENVIKDIDGILECYVMIVDEDKLIAYYSSNKETIDIKKYLQTKLPKYMVPKYIIKVDKFELNYLGKVDKTKLPRITIENKVKTLPQNEIQKFIYDDICKLLKIESIDINEDLFEYGVDSIILIRLVSDINIKYNISLTEKEVIENTNISDLSIIIMDLLDNNNNQVVEEVIVEDNNEENKEEIIIEYNNEENKEEVIVQQSNEEVIINDSNEENEEEIIINDNNEENKEEVIVEDNNEENKEEIIIEYNNKENKEEVIIQQSNEEVIINDNNEENEEEIIINDNNKENEEEVIIQQSNEEVIINDNNEENEEEIIINDNNKENEEEVIVEDNNYKEEYSNNFVTEDELNRILEMKSNNVISSIDYSLVENVINEERSKCKSKNVTTEDELNNIIEKKSNDKIVISNDKVIDDIVINNDIELDDIVDNNKVVKFNLTNSEKGILKSYFFDTESVMYNVPFEISFSKNNVDLNKFKEAIVDTVLNNKMLFSRVDFDNDKFYGILDYKDIKFDLDINYVSLDEYKRLKDKFVKSFDLFSDRLFDINLYIVDDLVFVLFNFNHIIFDGFSFSLLLEEIKNRYDNIDVLDKSSFYDNIINSRENICILDKDKNFYLSKFNGELPNTIIDVDFDRSENKDSDKISVVIDDELAIKIIEFSKKNKVTISNIFLGMFSLLLSKYTYNEDVILGMAFNSRSTNDELNSLGMFVKTLPLRFIIDFSLSIKDYFCGIQNDVMDYMKNSSYEYDSLIKDLNISREKFKNPLFNIVYTYQKNNSLNLYINDNLININEINSLESKFDILFEVINSDKFILNFEFNKSIYLKENIELLVKYYLNMFNYLDKEYIKDILLIDDKEKNYLLNEYNDTFVSYFDSKSVNEVFEDIVLKYGDKKAVVFENNYLTYDELNRKANKLARHLRTLRLNRNSVIAVLLDKSLEFAIGVMAIIKAGYAYLPINNDIPDERAKYMMENADVKCILTTKEYNRNILDIITVDINDEFNYDDRNLNLNIMPYERLYVIYTSGTTGLPKGIEILHKGILRLIVDNFLGYNDNDVMLLSGSITFDTSCYEFFIALLKGMTLHIVRKNNILNSIYLKNYLYSNNITTLLMPTPIFNVLVTIDYTIFENLRLLCVAGDVLLPKYAKILKYNLKNLVLVNEYGPTENTVISTYYIVNNINNNIPIGKPIVNSTAYIIDKCNNLCPRNIKGELCVGGYGVAKGYINNHELTNKQFIELDYINERIYKTGDLVCLNNDYDIEYISRIDLQIKINGQRIEILEIRNKILEIEGINDCYISYFDNKYLVAFYVGNVNYEDIIKYLKKYLPSYMIPTNFISIDLLPFNQNSKVDTKVLKEIYLNSINEETIVSTDEEELNNIQKIILNAFKEVLNIDNVNMDTDFFLNGGDSLMLVQVVSILNINDIKLSFEDVFKCKTPNEIYECYLNN